MLPLDRLIQATRRLLSDAQQAGCMTIDGHAPTPAEVQIYHRAQALLPAAAHHLSATPSTSSTHPLLRDAHDLLRRLSSPLR